MATNETKLWGADSLSGTTSFIESNLSKDVVDMMLTQAKSKLKMARNAVSLSPVGDFFALSNEMSNRLVANAPYTIIGTIYIHDGQWAIFSTDNTHSEIGIFDEHKLSYERYVNSDELNFNKANLIKGVGRIRMYCHRTVYWDDGINPSRFFDFDDIPWKGKWAGSDCKEFVYDNDSDCKYQDSKHRNNIENKNRRLDIKKIRLSFTTEKGLNINAKRSDEQGEIPNGTYCFVGAYTSGGVNNILTNFFNTSNKVVIFDHNNVSGSIKLDVDADEEFEEYSIFCLILINQQADIRYIGTYSTNIKTITINQLPQGSMQIPAAYLKNEYNIPEKSEGIYKAGDYLIRLKPTNHQNFNYQPLANKIKTYWVSVEYDDNYYRNGGTNVGYMRDEVYSFFIRWVYDTGDKSMLYHIPCNVEEHVGTLDSVDGLKKDTVYGDGIIRQIGYMQPYISEEKYDDKNKELWAELCGKNIRHHHMPDNNDSIHFSKGKIRVLGVHFSNILPPTKKAKKIKSDGTYEWIDVPVDNVIGYEIFRGSRIGNKSIIAKGMVNNMRYYYKRDIYGNELKETKIYYQNYPYNSTEDDKFIVNAETRHIYKFNGSYTNGYYDDVRYFDSKDNTREKNDDSIRLKTSGNVVSFHSPDMKYELDGFKNSPYLSAKELKIYGLLEGHMEDLDFFYTNKMPKFKLLSDTGLLMALIIGLGYAIFKMQGVRKNIVKAPDVDYGGTLTLAGTTTGGTGMTNVSAGAAGTQYAGVAAEDAVRTTLIEILNSTNIVQLAAGTNPSNTQLEAQQASGIATASLTGRSTTNTTEATSTPFDNIPKLMRVVNGVPIFLTFWSNGIDDLIEMMSSFAQYRSMVYQQTSHGIYDKWMKTPVMSRTIENSTYLNPYGTTTMSKRKNITSTTQNNGNDDFIYINNIERPDAVALNLSASLETNKPERSQIYVSDRNIHAELYSYYTALKQPLSSQYGQLQDIKTLPATTGIIQSNDQIVFGGDTFIARITEKNTMPFFRNYPYGFQDGYGYDFRDYRMVYNPKYWINSHPYNISEGLSNITKLLNRKVDVDFDAFKLNDRFTSPSVSIGKDGDDSIQNFETLIDTSLDENIKSQYGVVHGMEDIVKNNRNDVEEYLSDRNSKRQCSCNLNIVLDRKLVPDDDYAKKLDEYKNTYFNNLSDEPIPELDLTIPTFYAEDVADKDSIIYNRKNLFSPINCQYYSYKKSGDNDSYPLDDSKELSEIIIKKNELKEKAYPTSTWYDSKFKMSNSDYDKLCGYKQDVEKAELKLAIAKGYVHFMQMVDDMWKSNEEGEAIYESRACLCWGKNNADDEKDRQKLASELFEDSWSDDHLQDSEDTYKILSKGFQGYWAGTHSDIPYTMNPNALNPLLAYFISQETDIQILFPTLEDVKNNWARNNISSKAGNGNEGSNKNDEIKSDEFYPFYMDENNSPVFNNERIYEAWPEWNNAVNNIEENYGFKYEQGDLKPMNLMEAIKSVYGVSIPTHYDYISNNEKNEVKSFIQSNELNLKLHTGKLFTTSTMKQLAVISQNQYLDPLYVILENQIVDKDKFTNEACSPILYNNEAYYVFYYGKQPNENIEPDTVGVNQFMSALNAIKNLTIDRFYTGSNSFKYWTISGCRQIIDAGSKTNKHGRKKLNTYYMQENGIEGDKKTKVYRREKCDNMVTYFEKDRGGFKKTLKKLEKEVLKANKKYNKAYKKYQNKFLEKTGQDSSGFFNRLWNNIRAIAPSSYYALNHNYNSPYDRFKFFIDNCFMYSHISGVRDFYVESTENIAFRDWKDDYIGQYYDERMFNDMKKLFDSQIINAQEKFIFNKSLIPENLEIAHFGAGFTNYAKLQERDYNPIEEAECRQYKKNRVMYSDPSLDTRVTDGWRTYRLNDHYDFDDEVTKIVPLMDNQKILVLFRNSSPAMFNSQINISNRDIDAVSKAIQTVGTGMLFSSGNKSHMSNTSSLESGSCQDSLSAITTPSGVFYVSGDQGKVFQAASSFTELSTLQSGISQWLKKYMPYMLTRDKEVFSTHKFDMEDNPVYGIGIQTSYDNAMNVIYFSKKDYEIKNEYKKQATYLGNGIFRIGVSKVKLGDEKYFNDASFTISLDLKKGVKGWTSYHDWHPDLTMNANDRIYSTKGSGIYRHNDSVLSYCNFYGKDYPFEVEFELDTNGSVSSMRSVSYFLETFKYADNEYDRYHTLYDNFDSAIVYNTEQVSGKLNLIHQIDSDPLMSVQYPKINSDSIDVLWSKEEQRYRFNQFWDITKDRMNNVAMFNTEPNGYIRTINPKYVDYMKVDIERKKFRHYVNNIRLSRSGSEETRNVNFIFSLHMNLNQKSYR